MKQLNDRQLKVYKIEEGDIMELEKIESKYNLSIKNCNYILTKLYDKRDKVGARIDKLIVRGLDTEEAENKYQGLVDDIDLICRWRNNHPGCLLEGDLGFGEGAII